MGNGAREVKNVSLVGHTNLNGRPGFKMALQASGDRLYLYLGQMFHSGWTVVDVTDPSNPTPVNFLPGPDNTMTKNIQVADGLMITSLERPTEGHGPVGNPNDPDKSYEEGAYIWDVASDPTDPKLLGHYETGGQGTHRNFYSGGDFAYMTAWPSEFEGGMLTVVDLSEPTTPHEVARWWWPGQHSDDDEDATETFYFHGPAYVRGNRAFLSYGRVGPVILDVSNPTDPELVNRLEMGDGFGSVLGTHSFIPLHELDLAAVTTEAIRETSPIDGGDPLNYIALVDVSDERESGFDGSIPTGPKIVATVPLPTPEPGAGYSNYYEKPGRFGPHNVHHPRDGTLRYESADTLISTWFNAGLRIFDISDPLAPVEKGHYVPEPPVKRVGFRPKDGLVAHFEDVVVDYRNYIYCTDANAGLYVFESDLL